MSLWLSFVVVIAGALRCCACPVVFCHDCVPECMFLLVYNRKLTHSGVTTRGEVRQLPQGAKRQGALGGAFGRRIVCFTLQNSAEFVKRERS